MIMEKRTKMKRKRFYSVPRVSLAPTAQVTV